MSELPVTLIEEQGDLIAASKSDRQINPPVAVKISDHGTACVLLRIQAWCPGRRCHRPGQGFQFPVFCLLEKRDLDASATESSSARFYDGSGISSPKNVSPASNRSIARMRSRFA